MAPRSQRTRSLRRLITLGVTTSTCPSLSRQPSQQTARTSFSPSSSPQWTLDPRSKMITPRGTAFQGVRLPSLQGSPPFSRHLRPMPSPRRHLSPKLVRLPQCLPVICPQVPMAAHSRPSSEALSRQARIRMRRSRTSQRSRHLQLCCRSSNFKPFPARVPLRHHMHRLPLRV